MYNQTHLKILGTAEEPKLIKLITFKKVRQSGIEQDFNYTEKCSVNDEKLETNLSRTKTKIFELAICNHWDWYFTGTLDPLKFDRSDLELFHKSLTQFIRNYNKKHKLQIKFLLIPELHKDGKSWHIHGFLCGLPQELLHRFVVGDKMGSKLAEKVLKGEELYSWSDYLSKFGFNDLEPIKSEVAVSKYVTKYITKDLASNVKELNAHQYYHSRGLQTSKTIKKGTMYCNIVPQFENEYIKTATFEYSEKLLSELLNAF